jgi:hypothetical protein
VYLEDYGAIVLLYSIDVFGNRYLVHSISKDAAIDTEEYLADVVNTYGMDIVVLEVVMAQDFDKPLRYDQEIADMCKRLGFRYFHAPKETWRRKLLAKILN